MFLIDTERSFHTDKENEISENIIQLSIDWSQLITLNYSDKNKTLLNCKSFADKLRIKRQVHTIEKQLFDYPFEEEG